ncbi:hypothetical protein J5N97_023094 [Dioscorea zingiberensis]|uniref:Uncharacterized protein n=1 Tax=Dioscorea zingiberensis TaxID=325984 RepID=A0A9D5HBG2_9LILI|nr:hypothetical protein J5N97_023094 [Dioscorea zingiberensis]
MQVETINQGDSQPEANSDDQGTAQLGDLDNQFGWALAGPRRGRGRGRGRGPNSGRRNPEKSSQEGTWRPERKDNQHMAPYSGSRPSRGGRGGLSGQTSHIPRDRDIRDLTVQLSDKDFPPLSNPSSTAVCHPIPPGNIQLIPTPIDNQLELAVVERRPGKEPIFPLPEPRETRQTKDIPNPNQKLSVPRLITSQRTARRPTSPQAHPQPETDCRYATHDCLVQRVSRALEEKIQNQLDDSHQMEEDNSEGSFQS